MFEAPLAIVGQPDARLAAPSMEELEDEFDFELHAKEEQNPDNSEESQPRTVPRPALTGELARQAGREVPQERKAKVQVQCGACEDSTSGKSKYCSKHRRAQECLRRSAFKGAPVQKKMSKPATQRRRRGQAAAVAPAPRRQPNRPPRHHLQTQPSP